MNNKILIDFFKSLKDEKNIYCKILMSIIKNYIFLILKRKYVNVDNYKIIFNYEKSNIEICRQLIIVSDGMIKNINKQIELSIAKKINKNIKLGEKLNEKIEFKNFCRKDLFFLRRKILTKISNYNNNYFIKYNIGEIINVEVYKKKKQNIIIIDENKKKMILPKKEQMFNDFFKKGDRILVMIKKIKFKKKKIHIILSRKDKKFIKKIFELEIPEISDGLIIIKKIVRIAGERSKISIDSSDTRINPIGVCVGNKGDRINRINNLIKEISNENIDIINYTSNIKSYLRRALSPAKVALIKIDEKNKLAYVFVKPEEIAKAIGRKKSNIRLASKLTGYKLYLLKIEKKDF